MTETSSPSKAGDTCPGDMGRGAVVEEGGGSLDKCDSSARILDKRREGGKLVGCSAKHTLHVEVQAQVQERSSAPDQIGLRQDSRYR